MSAKLRKKWISLAKIIIPEEGGMPLRNFTSWSNSSLTSDLHSGKWKIVEKVVIN